MIQLRNGRIPERGCTVYNRRPDRAEAVGEGSTKYWVRDEKRVEDCCPENMSIVNPE
jgi:hypothetical protein